MTEPTAKKTKWEVYMGEVPRPVSLGVKGEVPQPVSPGVKGEVPLIYALTTTKRITCIANWFDIGRTIAVYRPQGRHRTFDEDPTPDINNDDTNINNIILYVDYRLATGQFRNAYYSWTILKNIAMIPFKMPMRMIKMIIVKVPHHGSTNTIESEIPIWHNKCNLYMPNFVSYKYATRIDYTNMPCASSTDKIIVYMFNNGLYHRPIIRYLLLPYFNGERLITEKIKPHKILANIWQFVGWIRYGCSSYGYSDIKHDGFSDQFKIEIHKDIEYVTRQLGLDPKALHYP